MKIISNSLLFVYNCFLIYFSMERENKNKYFLIWIEEIWEEIEVQFYGIVGAIFFFGVIYFIFQPQWMITVFDFISKIKLLVG